MADPTENGHTEGDGESIADRAEAIAHGDTPDEELFPLGVMEGDPWTLDQIRKSKKPIEVTVALSRAEVPMRDGLPDPGKSGRVAATHETAKYEVVPVKEEQPDGEKIIVSWKIRVNLRVTYVQQMGDTESVVKREFERLTVEDLQRANEVAEDLLRYAASFPHEAAA